MLARAHGTTLELQRQWARARDAAAGRLRAGGAASEFGDEAAFELSPDSPVKGVAPGAPSPAAAAASAAADDDDDDDDDGNGGGGVSDAEIGAVLAFLDPNNDGAVSMGELQDAFRVARRAAATQARARARAHSRKTAPRGFFRLPRGCS